MKRNMIIISILIVLTAGGINAQLTLDNWYANQLSIPDQSSQPVAFTENYGQWDAGTLFKAEAGNVTFYFGGGEVSYLFVRDTDEVIYNERIAADHSAPVEYRKEYQLIKARFIDANHNPEVIAEDRLPHYTNYFYGNDPANWQTYVPSYSTITYKDVWPGIDVKYYGNGKSMKYDFVISPGADIDRIKIRYEGVSELAIANTGELQAQTKFGLVYENIPEIYQETVDGKSPLSGYYRLIEPGVFGFEIENYDASKTLVIDPELVFSTYLSGSSDDRGCAVSHDDSGNIYVCGEAYSSDFPTVDPYDDSMNGVDTFISKFSPTGSLTYSTFLGGSNNDYPSEISVDDSGNIYVSGYTYSSDFPTANAYSSSNSGSYDSFITKMSPAGDSLMYSTYFGGSADENYNYHAIDNSGKVYLLGQTTSSDLPTANAYCDSLSHSGIRDVFIARFSSSGNSLEYCTYLGGTDHDYPLAIAADNSGNAYITGYTDSDDFPMVNAYDDSYGDNYDGFVAKLSIDSQALLFSTYLGGTGNDYGRDIDIDNSGNIYITGNTTSTDFPICSAYNSSHNGSHDVFLSKMTPGGDSLHYSTFLGGSGADEAYGLVVNESGYAYISGNTNSSDFPTVDAYDDNVNGNYDIFISVFSPDASYLDFSSYFGGTYREYVKDIDVDNSGNTYITGYTTSDDFPMYNAYDSTFSGNVMFDQPNCFVAAFEIPAVDIESSPGLPETYQLTQNYPNPFNNSTVIYYDLVDDCHVTLQIYDILGRYVDRIVDEPQQAGSHQVVWNADDVSSGVYFYMIEAGDYSSSMKMSLVK